MHDAIVPGSFNTRAKRVTLDTIDGLYKGKRVQYLHQDASVELVAALEGSTLAPNLDATPGLASFDRFGVDGVIEGGSTGVGAMSGVLRRVQNGFVRSYALSLLGGALLVVLALLAVNLA